MATAIPRWISFDSKQNRWFYFTLFAWWALVWWRVSRLSDSFAAIAIGLHMAVYGALVLFLVWRQGGEALRAPLEDEPSRFGWLVAGNIAMTLFYQAMTNSMSPLSVACGIVYWLTPWLLLRQAQKNKVHCGVFDILLLLSLWAPIHSGLISVVYAAPSASIGTTLAAWPAMVTLAVATISVRQFEDVGLTLQVEPGSWKEAARYGLFALTTLLIYGLAAGRITDPTWPTQLVPLASTLITTWLFVSLPGELLFRGLILNILEKTSGSTWLAVACAAVISGVAGYSTSLDLIHTGAGIIAGVFYGLVYLKTASVMPGAIVHAVIVTAMMAVGM